MQHLLHMWSVFSKKDFLIDPDVVDEHFVGELAVVNFETGPVTSHGYVQQKEEGLMEGVGAASVIFDRNFVVLEIVYIHDHELFIPSEFVCMELGDVKFFLCAVVVAGVVTVLGVVPFVLPVVGAVYDVLAVDGFDDIDFAAGGPGNLIDVFAEHPEGGPDALAGGERDACFYGAVGKAELALGNHSRRGVACAFVAFFVCADVENAILDVSVFATVSVVFTFVVTPSAGACANFESPLVGIDGLAFEFVTPEVR